MATKYEKHTKLRIRSKSMISIEQVKKLRQETDVSITECKKALETAKGDFEKAKELLRKWGGELAKKKSQREAGQGIIESYINQNKKVGVLVDLGCESDFVAKSDDFQKLAHEICLQVVAASPLFIKEEDIPEDLIKKEKAIYQAQSKNTDKPKEIINQIVEGKLKKFRKEISLLSQPWIKEEKKAVKELIDEYVAKLGENIVVRRFIRYEI